MSFFKRIKISKNDSPEKIKKGKKEKDLDTQKLKKKTKIGFRHKNKENIPKERIRKTEKEEKKVETKPVQLEDNLPEESESEIETDKIVNIPDELMEEEPNTTKKDERWSPPKKKKKILLTDLKGKPVFLEDTGEKLGTVFDAIYDKENNLIGYKIKDFKSDAVLSFPIDQFDEDKNGLIFIPGWYTHAVKNIEKFEFKDRISPELTSLLTDDTISNRELYNIFAKHDDEMAKYIEDATSLKETLNNRLKVLEKQRLALKDSLMDLTEKRLIKDIDRREFSEDVMEHRRRANILDANISKCKDLLQRLNRTSFGVLGKSQGLFNLETEDYLSEKTLDTHKEKNKVLYENEKSAYKNKYYNLKEQFEQLEDEYLELKTAVEKLMHKNEI